MAGLERMCGRARSIHSDAEGSNDGGPPSASTLVPGWTATAWRCTATSTRTNVPAGASSSSPSSVNLADDSRSERLPQWPPFELRLGPGKGVHLLELQGSPSAPVLYGRPQYGRGPAYDRPVLGPARLRRSCLRLPGSVEEFPFGEEVSVFKVAGKVFALSPLKSRPLTVSLKCEPEIAEQLRTAHPAVRPGYHLNKRHWNTVEIDGSLEDRSILDMIEDSYDLVVDGLPKRVQAELGWPPARREPS